MKNNLIVFVSLALLLATLVSCGTAATDTSPKAADAGAGEADAAAETTEAAAALPNYLTLEADWNGQSYRVLTTHCPAYEQFTNFEVASEAEDGEVVNDAVYRRNSVISEKFNVNIEEVIVEGTNATPTEAYAALSKAVLAGDDICDTFFMAMRCVGSVINAGYTTDLYSLPYIDFDGSYWNQSTNRSLEIGGKLMMTNSDFSLLDKKRTYILVYNRDLVAEYSDKKLEDMVKNGTWTYDELIAISEKMSSDLNGDGVIDNNDQWGIGMDSVNGVLALMIGMDAHLTNKDSDGNIIYTALEPHTVDVFQKLYDTLNGNNNAYYCGQYGGWKREGYSKDSDSGHSFKAGMTAFVTSFPQSLPKYSADCDFDYGVIAWPKYNEAQQNYYTFADRWGFALFGVPVTTSNTDLVGFMLETLSGYSTDTSYHAYLEVACKVKYVYDETSAEMLDLCFKNIAFELGMFFDWGKMYTGGQVVQQVMDGKSFNYVSTMSSMQEAVEAGIAETMTAVVG